MTQSILFTHHLIVNKRRKTLNVLFQWILLSRSSGYSQVGVYQRVGGTYSIVRVEPWYPNTTYVQCPRKQHQLIGRRVDWEGVGRGIGLPLYLPGGTEENRSAACLAADISNSGPSHAKQAVFGSRLPRCSGASRRQCGLTHEQAAAWTWMGHAVQWDKSKVSSRSGVALSEVKPIWYSCSVSKDNIKWELRNHCVCCALDGAGPYCYLLTCLVIVMMMMMIVVVRNNEECEAWGSYCSDYKNSDLTGYGAVWFGR